MIENNINRILQLLIFSYFFEDEDSLSDIIPDLQDLVNKKIMKNKSLKNISDKLFFCTLNNHYTDFINKNIMTLVFNVENVEGIDISNNGHDTGLMIEIVEFNLINYIFVNYKTGFIKTI